MMSTWFDTASASAFSNVDASVSLSVTAYALRARSWNVAVLPFAAASVPMYAFRPVASAVSEKPESALDSGMKN